MTIAFRVPGSLLKNCEYVLQLSQLLMYKQLYENQLHIVNMDIGSDRSVQEAAAYIYSQTKYLDVLINNAGILGDIEGTVKTNLDFDEMLTVYNVNSVGLYG